jgi:antitoxin (DNA-binding transcriptional repressor) of toxin-antitoxin stability system
MNDEQYMQATVGQQSPVPRKKVRFSAQNERPGPNVITLWTGCAFETPPGWGLWIRSPINREYAVPFRIDEGILETDWLGHDFWMNLNFYRPGETAHLRRDGPPIAHIVPVPRQAYAGWEIEEAVMNRDSDEAAAAFDRWYAFSYEKFFAKGEKDRTVYHRQRRAALKRENDEAL